MASLTDQFRRRLPFNITSGMANYGLKALVSIFLTPYLMLKLGTASYGLIALAGVFTLYAAIITNQIAGALNRFLSIEIQKDDGRPSVFFSSAFVLFAGLCLVQIPVFAVLIWLAPELFNIPDFVLTDMYILLICTTAAFLVNLFGSVYMVPVYAKNRLDVLGVVSFCLEVLRVALIVAAFVWLGPKLRYVGYAGLIQATLTFLFNMYLCRRFAPELRFSPKLFDLRQLTPVLGMSGWTLLNSLGNVLFNFTAVWIINRFIDADMAGIYAAIMIIPNSLTTLIIVGLNNLAPMASTYYAKGQHEQLFRLMKLSMKLSGLFFAVPLGFFYVFAGDVLTVWLGPQYAVYGWIVVVTMLGGIFSYVTIPLNNLRTVLNKVRVPGLMFCLLGGLSLVTGFMAGVKLGYGIAGVIVANVVCLAIYSWLFVPLYGAKIMHKPDVTFFAAYPWTLVTVIFACLVSYVLKCVFGAFVFWGGLFVYVCICEILGLVFIWFVGLNADERRQFWLLLPQKLRRRLRKEI